MPAARPLGGEITGCPHPPASSPAKAAKEATIDLTDILLIA
jgi:hypothetical protein